jgi:hypothetical protein
MKSTETSMKSNKTSMKSNKKSKKFDKTNIFLINFILVKYEIEQNKYEIE